MSDDEVKVGSFNKPTKRPTPKTPVVETATADAKEGGASNDELNAKLDKILEFMQAIDWKMWVYLKANNYID